MIIAELKIKDVELADGRTSNDVCEEWIEAVVDFGNFKKGDIVQGLGHNCSDSVYEEAGLTFIKGKGWVLEGEEDLLSDMSWRKMAYTKSDNMFIILSPFSFAWHNEELMQKNIEKTENAILLKFGLEGFENREVKNGESNWCEARHIFYKKIDTPPVGVSTFEGDIQDYLS